MIRRIARWSLAAAAVTFAIVAYVYATLPDVRPLATQNPTTTAFMDLRAREAAADGRPLRRVQVWVPYARISQNLKKAVLVAEDDAFFEHEGVDVEQIRRSIELDLARGRAIRGGSTITQQLAKNLYLSPSRNPLRKVRELIIARRLEAELSKARIFELYLNVIEWGDGVWGAEAAARAYFHTSAAALSREQAALLAGAIVNPRLLNPAHPPARLIRRQRIILARMPAAQPPVLVPVATPAAPSAPPEQAPVIDQETGAATSDESAPAEADPATSDPSASPENAPQPAAP